jgi:hypothetical protein
LASMAVEKAQVGQAGKEFGRLEEICLAGVNQALSYISTPSLKARMHAMSKAFSDRLLKIGLRQSYEETFDALQSDLHHCEAEMARLHSELLLTIKNINTLHGFAIALMSAPKLGGFADKLTNIRLSYLHHLEFTHSWRLLSHDYSERLVQTLCMQIRVIFESAHADIDTWTHSTVQVLETELMERKRSLAKRMAAVSGVQTSSADTDAQIAVLDAQLEAIRAQGRRLVALSKEMGSDLNAHAQQNLGV